jgi:hypothetical protein
MQVQSYANGASNALVEGWQFVEDSTTPNSVVPALVTAWNSDNLDPASFATAAQGAKADSALQSETDPTVPAWAKTPSKPSYTKAEVGLGNVDNTSDANKPVSTAQQAALDLKAALSGGAAANFTAMPQVDGAPVVESGTSANGSWVKYANGYIRQSGSIVTPLGLDAGIPAGQNYPVLFPVIFANTNYSFKAGLSRVENAGSLDQTGKLYANGFWWSSPTTSGFQIQSYPYTVNLFGTAMFNWTAEGMWK